MCCRFNFTSENMADGTICEFYFNILSTITAFLVKVQLNCWNLKVKKSYKNIRELSV